MVEAGVTVIVMNRKAEVIDLVQRKAEIARLVRLQCAFHLDDPGISLFPGIHFEALAATHQALVEDHAIFGSTLARVIAQQVHELVGIQLGLYFISGFKLIPAAAHLATPAFYLDLAAAFLDVLGDAL